MLLFIDSFYVTKVKTFLGKFVICNNNNDSVVIIMRLIFVQSLMIALKRKQCFSFRPVSERWIWNFWIAIITTTNLAFLPWLGHEFTNFWHKKIYSSSYSVYCVLSECIVVDCESSFLLTYHLYCFGSPCVAVWCDINDILLLCVAVRKCLTSPVDRWHRQKQNILRTACAASLLWFLNCACLYW